MGLFGRKSKSNDDLSVGGLPGTAVVQRRRSQFGSDEGEQREELKIDLEVRLDDGRAPYAVSGTYPVPRDFLTLAEGNEVPVKADPDDPKRLWFDWDAFVAAGGRALLQEQGNKHQRDAAREVVSGAIAKDPAQVEAQRQVVASWIEAVKDGSMSKSDFLGYLDERVTAGTTLPEDADAARAAVADLP